MFFVHSLAEGPVVSRFTRTESSLDSETCSPGQVTSGPCITRYSRGVRTGPVWLSLLGGGWLHGVPDQRGEMTGHQIMYIYPDLTTVLCGSFTKGVMVRAVQSTLVDVGKYLKHFTPTNVIPSLRFQGSSSCWPGQHSVGRMCVLQLQPGHPALHVSLPAPPRSIREDLRGGTAVHCPRSRPTFLLSQLSH